MTLTTCFFQQVIKQNNPHEGTVYVYLEKQGKLCKWDIGELSNYAN